MKASLKIFRGDLDHVNGLRIGSRLGKYRVRRRLGEGGFATVYAAYDVCDHREVALKVPDVRFVTNLQSFDDVKREVQIMAEMDHPSVLQLEDAGFIDGQFVMVFPLGEETLADRLRRRLARSTAVEYVTQMVAAVGYAHEQCVLHRDIKPENFILFPGNDLRLTDFGLARIEAGRHDESASGTLGFIAPEQAMGRPTYRSDVFSLGLVIYRMLSGELPEYPFDAPLPGYNRLRRGLSRDFVSLIRKSIDPTPSRRFRDAVAMHNAIKRIKHLLSDGNGGPGNPSALRRSSSAA